jgi:tetratricopeptide (TPR) repeat protein
MPDPKSTAAPGRDLDPVAAQGGGSAPGIFALERLNPLRWFRSESLEAQLARAALLLERKSYVQAQHLYQEILSKDEGCLLALRGLGTALMLQGGRSNLLAAQAHLQEVVRQAPEDLPVHVALANIYDKLGRPEEADRQRRIAAILKRLQQEPENPAANNNLGILLVQQKQWERALACFRKALDANPKLDVAWRNVAATCYQLAQAEVRPEARQVHVAAGLAAAEKAIEIKPNLPSLLTIALLKSIGGDTQAAVDVLAQAQAQAPENKDVYAVMRTVLERAGLFDEALKASQIYEELALE